MADKKWRFREDIAFQYINGTSSRTFQDAEDRLNYLEEKEQLPDMREKVKEYISELDASIDRYKKLVEENMNYISTKNIHIIIARMQTLTEVKDDLQSRLDELV